MKLDKVGRPTYDEIVKDAITRARLIEVGIELFGQGGPDAVSTRALADAAGARQSAISYHFGSKEQLYLACAEHIAAAMKAKVAPLLAAAADPGAQPGARLEETLCGLATLMVQDEIAPLARFVVREQMSPSPAFAVLYDGAMRDVIEMLTRLLAAAAGGRLTDEAARVRCVTLVGQAFAVRYARAALLRATGWQTIAGRETALIRDAVAANTRAVVAALATPAPEPAKEPS